MAPGKGSEVDNVSLVGDNMDGIRGLLRIEQTGVYRRWFSRLRDRMARIRIAAYFDKALALGGLHGDYKSVGDDVIEVRFDMGPGYRVYLARDGGEIVLLLVGGDKSSQDRDVRKAKRLAKKWRQGHEDL